MRLPGLPSPHEGSCGALSSLDTRLGGVSPGSPAGTQSSGLSLEAAHIGTLCLIHQHSRLPEGEPVFSINHMVCTNSPGTENQTYQLTDDVDILRAKFPDASQGPAL